jgi:hypothetical protein
VPETMPPLRCEERNRLFDLFIVAVYNYGHADDLAMKAAREVELQKRVNETWDKCEAAREALTKHCMEHNC